MDSGDSGLTALRPVARTGVIFVTTEAERQGSRAGDPDWCNLGQGMSEAGPLSRAPRRVEVAEPSAHDHGFRCSFGPPLGEIERAPGRLEPLVGLPLATGIASLGLSENSAATVIGAMVVAPLGQPIVALGAAIGVALAPPLCTASMILEEGRSIPAFGGLILFLANLAGITGAAIVVFLATGTRSGRGGRPEFVGGVVGVALLALLICVSLLANSERVAAGPRLPRDVDRATTKALRLSGDGPRTVRVSVSGALARIALNELPHVAEQRRIVKAISAATVLDAELVSGAR